MKGKDNKRELKRRDTKPKATMIRRGEIRGRREISINEVWH